MPAHLAYVGPIEVGQGVLIVLSAVVDRPTLQVTLAGVGPDRARVEEHAADLGLGARIHLTGEVGGTALVNLCRSLDLLVVPPLWAGGGGRVKARNGSDPGVPKDLPGREAAVTALDLGVPVVTAGTDLGTLGPGVQVVTPGDAVSLRQAIAAVLDGQRD